jgi:5-methylcytosine-specific restriction protein A
MMLPRPCVDCGVVVRATRCLTCARVLDRKRPSRLDRGYDAEWRKLSKAARAAQPWCSICKSTKDLTADHIQALADGGLSVWSNIQVLCRKCNSRKGDQ